MAEKKEYPTETGSDTSREERLESARRKYEEMKKKKKSKKKTDKNNEGDNKILTEQSPDSTSETKTEEEEKQEEKKTEEKKRKEEKGGARKEETKEEEEEEEEDKKGDKQLGASEQTHDPEQFKSLHVTIQERDSTIQRLSSENAELVRTKHTLENRITELEKQLQQLSFAEHPKDVTLTHEMRNFPQEYINEYSDKRNVPKGGYDFRENLMAWKGWQVDMRNWNQSSKLTQVIL